MDDYWEEAMRRETQTWNKGFRWGVFWGFMLSFGSILVINWIVP